MTTLVRGNHEWHYRPGEWAVVRNMGERLDGRPVIDVEFRDGAVDTWVTDDKMNPLEYWELS